MKIRYPIISGRYQNQVRDYVLLLYPQYFAVIAHNTEQHCGFGSALPPEESHITTGGNLSPVLEPLTYDHDDVGQKKRFN